MKAKKSIQDVANKFKNDMQKLSDKYSTSISIEFQGKEHLISKPKNMKTEEPKKTKQAKHFLKYQFTHDEIHGKGIELARITSELAAIENERKAVASEFKAKIDTKSAEMEVLGNHINNGYEHRYIACTEILNQPRIGIKTIVRNDTNEIVSETAMNSDEMQSELEFDQP